MNVCVVGTGYVGLVTVARLADFGMKVVGIDKDAEKVEALTRREILIHEPELSTVVRTDMDADRLCLSTDPGPAIEGAVAIFIAVGTPSRAAGWVILIEWNQFRDLDLGRLDDLRNRPLIVGLANTYDPVNKAAARFEYVSVGRPAVGIRESVFV